MPPNWTWLTSSVAGHKSAWRKASAKCLNTVDCIKEEDIVIVMSPFSLWTSVSKNPNLIHLFIPLSWLTGHLCQSYGSPALNHILVYDLFDHKWDYYVENRDHDDWKHWHFQIGFPFQTQEQHPLLLYSVHYKQSTPITWLDTQHSSKTRQTVSQMDRRRQLSSAAELLLLAPSSLISLCASCTTRTVSSRWQRRPERRYLSHNPEETSSASASRWSGENMRRRFTSIS